MPPPRSTPPSSDYTVKLSGWGCAFAILAMCLGPAGCVYVIVKAFH